MLHPAMRHVLGIGDDLMAGIQRGEKEALSAFSQRVSSYMPGTSTVNFNAAEEVMSLGRGATPFQRNTTNTLTGTTYVDPNVQMVGGKSKMTMEFGGTYQRGGTRADGSKYNPTNFTERESGQIHRDLMQNSPEYRASALEFGREQRQQRIDQRSLEAVDDRFARINRGQQLIATHDESKLVGKRGNLPLGAQGPIQHVQGARDTFQLQNRRGQGGPGVHSFTFPEFKTVGDVTMPQKGTPRLSPVERAQNEVIANYSATSKGLGGAASDKSGPLGFEEAYRAASKTTDKNQLTLNKSKYKANLEAGMSEEDVISLARNDYRYQRYLEGGGGGYDPIGGINKEIDRAFDGSPKVKQTSSQKSNGSINPVSSEKAGAGDVTPGDMGYAGFSSGFERHAAGAVIGAGMGMMSEGEVSVGGAARGAMFGVVGGKAARMFTGSMRGGAVNSMARGVGDTLSAAGEGTMRKTAGDYINKTMSGFDAAKSQEAMRIATFAGAGLAGFSMGRDRNHSRGMNGSRGSRF